MLALFLPCATVGFLSAGPPRLPPASALARSSRTATLAGRARAHDSTDDDDDNDDDDDERYQDRHGDFVADVTAFESLRGHPLVRVGASLVSRRERRPAGRHVDEPQ